MNFHNPWPVTGLLIIAAVLQWVGASAWGHYSKYKEAKPLLNAVLALELPLIALLITFFAGRLSTGAL